MDRYFAALGWYFNTLKRMFVRDEDDDSSFPSNEVGCVFAVAGAILLYGLYFIWLVLGSIGLIAAGVLQLWDLFKGWLWNHH